MCFLKHVFKKEIMVITIITLIIIIIIVIIIIINIITKTPSHCGSNINTKGNNLQRHKMPSCPFVAYTHKTFILHTRSLAIVKLSLFP